MFDASDPIHNALITAVENTITATLEKHGRPGPSSFVRHLWAQQLLDTLPGVPTQTDIEKLVKAVPDIMLSDLAAFNWYQP